MLQFYDFSLVIVLWKISILKAHIFVSWMHPLTDAAEGLRVLKLSMVST